MGGESKMEGNERPSTEAAVPKTDAGSAATQTTQPSVIRRLFSR